MNEPRFKPDVSRRLREVATEDEIAVLRKVVAEAEHGHQLWYLALLRRLLEELRRQRSP
jgi:hypothetical protein